MFSANAIFASLIWGAIGTGYLVFGRKQRSLIPALGGVFIIAASYFFADSALLLSLLCVGLMIAVYFLVKRYGW
jgi:hypothetical protein